MKIFCLYTLFSPTASLYHSGSCSSEADGQPNKSIHWHDWHGGPMIGFIYSLWALCLPAILLKNNTKKKRQRNRGVLRSEEMVPESTVGCKTVWDEFGMAFDSDIVITQKHTFSHSLKYTHTHTHTRTSVRHYTRNCFLCESQRNTKCELMLPGLYFTLSCRGGRPDVVMWRTDGTPLLIVLHLPSSDSWVTWHLQWLFLCVHEFVSWRIENCNV